MHTRQLLNDIIQWDVASWRPALDCWDRCVENRAGLQVLDVGARDGGLSLYFALKGFQVVCSDLGGPTPQALELHRKHGVADRVSYAAMNATAIGHRDGTFDIVCFKSVLGGIGWGDRYDTQAQAIREMHRVLKPGGCLLFAENLRASRLHSVLRRRFARWGKGWRYPTLGEMRTLLAPFSQVELNCCGFLAAFGHREWQRRLLHWVDVPLNPLIPADARYIAYGCARK